MVEFFAKMITQSKDRAKYAALQKKKIDWLINRKVFESALVVDAKVHLIYEPRFV